MSRSSCSSTGTESFPERLGKTRACRLLALLAGKRERQADHDPLRAALLDEVGDLLQATLRLRPLDLGQRRGDHSAGIDIAAPQRASP